MNHFATVTRPDSRCVPSIGPTSVGDDLTSRKIFADHKAHWYRSSAVLLHYHKYVMIFGAANGVRFLQKLMFLKKVPKANVKTV